MAARAKGVAKSVSIFARRPETVAELANAAWCDRASADLAEACEGAELIVLCAPVERIIGLAADLAAFASGNPIVTDVGSVKSEIARRCQAALAGKARFVGSHPMAGSEKTGMANARPELFEGRVCFVTPTAETDSAARERVVDFWKALGCRVLLESPENHDEIAANVSHLPHILASALSLYLARACPSAADFCGNGLRDTTRVASGDPGLWREIIAQNRPEIRRAIAAFQDELQAFAADIANENDFAVLRRLADAKTFRDRL